MYHESYWIAIEVRPAQADPLKPKEVGKVIFNAFTQVHVDVVDTIVEGDRVVERHRATARHTDEFMGIRPTNRDVFWTENHIYRMQGRMIAETWSEVSFHDLLRQIRDRPASSGRMKGNTRHEEDHSHGAHRGFPRRCVSGAHDS